MKREWLSPASEGPADASRLGGVAVEESALARRVEVLEQLAANDPSTYSARLAWEVGKLGDLYGEAGHESERLTCYKRAADIMRERAQAPDAVASDHWDLQQHLFNFASVSRRVGESDRVLGAIDEAIERADNLDPASAPLTLLFGSYLAQLHEMRDGCIEGIRTPGQNSCDV